MRWNWLQVLSRQSLDKLAARPSRFRLLAKHRCGLQFPRARKAVCVLISTNKNRPPKWRADFIFVEMVGIEPTWREGWRQGLQTYAGWIIFPYKTGKKRGKICFCLSLSLEASESQASKITPGVAYETLAILMLLKLKRKQVQMKICLQLFLAREFKEIACHTLPELGAIIPLSKPIIPLKHFVWGKMFGRSFAQIIQ